jgi:glycosyltransferase involved in cell wall biosynthesis
MGTMDLSILIPAKNEEFLGKTIENLLENIEADTEIIAVLDGYEVPVPEIPVDPRVTVVKLNESIGQRAATNLACRLAKGKYVAKTDAHCAFAKGFDRVLLEDMQPDWTVVPIMRNLHAFDWVCEDGHRRYQGPSGPCECGKPTVKDIKWIGKESPQSTAYTFDKEPHFQYDSEQKRKQEGDLVETMSLQGSFFMLSREKYWELNISDEQFGSWGQQGIEVAVKTWLSGGKVICNRKTWYAHMFRTQGGDFSFPYKLSGDQVQHARKTSREYFYRGEFGGKHSLWWLIDKFKPKYWAAKKSIIYYTDNQLDEQIAVKCREQLLKSGLPIVSASLKPLDFGKNIVIEAERGYLTMFRQILAALEASDSDYVFFCEHDVLYHPSHFLFVPPRDDTYYYNVNVWKAWQDGFCLKVDDCRQLSGLCANRQLLIQHFKERVRRVESEGFSRKMGFEPGTHNRPERVDDYKSDIWRSDLPNVDLRHNTNMTSSRRSKEQFRNQKYTQGWTESDSVPGWGKAIDLWPTSH